MKKLILLLVITLFTLPLMACQKEVPDYSIEEAFTLMNVAIQNYLDCDSLSLEYSGSYDGSNYQINEFMRVKMKNIGEDNFIGQVEMYVTENGTDFNSVADYESGWVYTARETDSSTDYVKKQLEQTEYVTLYKSFLKSTIDYSSTRDQSILIDANTLTVHFELSSSDVTSTFFVTNVLDTVNFATVDITLDHDANLLSMSVEYAGKINSIEGTEKYNIAILKMNQYIVISQLSSSEKALYQEDTQS
ncbi:MAG: hypothetical protein AB7U79_01555 [Candidatus Izemoplasmatales bacterium]